MKNTLGEKVVYRRASSKRKSASKGSIPQGRPKSGRIWKASKNRFSSMKCDKPFNTSWDQKMQLRQVLKLVKQQEQALKQAKQQAREERKKKREENLRRRDENAKKAEIVQVIKNVAKLRRMSKAQLRNIRKR